MKIKHKRISVALLMLAMLLSSLFGNYPVVNVYAQGNYTGADIVDSLSVSPTDISHNGNFTISLTFSGQSEDPDGDRYIYPGKEIYIPIESDGVAQALLASQLPQIENAEVTVDGNGIRIRFLDGIQNQYDISGNIRITMSGLNTEEESTHTLIIGGEYEVNISNYAGGSVGVFAGKTGMMYADSRPGYVTWFLRGNINGDAWPGGPLEIYDKLGAGQELDGSGIHIGLYWGGQLNSTYSKTYSSIDEFLADPDYGSSQGSSINYNITTGEINIYIPETVLNGKEFAFTYDALITDYDLDEFTNKGVFDFYENGNPDRIEENAVVTNVDQGGEIVGKTRAWLNINKVINGTTTPIPNVTFEIVREDGGLLYQGKDDVKVALTTDENGQIRAQGFRPGKLVLKEIDAPEWIEFDPSKSIVLELDAGNKNDINTIENDVKTIDLAVTKLWSDANNQDGIRPEKVTVKLLADGVDTGKELILSEANQWTGTFTELDEYKAGKLIVYTVKEVKVEGYTTVVSGDVETGYVITNTHEVEQTEVEKTDLTVTKLWDDENDKDGLRPESVTIKLLADGKETGQELILSESNNWTGSFTALDVYKADGLIVYTIEEVKVEGYEAVISGNVETGYVITNIHEVEQTEVEKTDLTVTKLWDDENDKDGLRPESVTIKLLADGKETGQELILSESNNWTGSFTALDVYKADGLIVYTIEEVKVEGYEVVISGDVDSGFLVTNTHEVEKISNEEEPEEEPKKPNETLPQTGEGLNLVLYGVAMLLLGSVLTILGIRRKKEIYRKEG